MVETPAAARIFWGTPAGVEVGVAVLRGHHAVADRFLAGAGEFAGDEVGGEVEAGEESGGVDPGAAAVPAFDGGGVEEFLAHEFEGAVDLLGFGEADVEGAEAADDELHGALDLAVNDIVGVERGAGEEGVEDRLNVVVILADDGGKGVDEVGRRVRRCRRI